MKGEKWLTAPFKGGILDFCDARVESMDGRETERDDSSPRQHQQVQTISAVG